MVAGERAGVRTRRKGSKKRGKIMIMIIIIMPFVVHFNYLLGFVDQKRGRAESFLFVWGA